MSSSGDVTGSEAGVAEKPHPWTIWLSIIALMFISASAAISFFSYRQSQTATSIAQGRAAPLIYSTDALVVGEKLAAQKTLYVAVRLRNFGELPAKTFTRTTTRAWSHLPKSSQEPRKANLLIRSLF